MHHHSSHALHGQGGACLHEAAAATWRAALLADDACRFPRRPYCANELEYGLRVRDLEQALTKAHIQVNPPTARLWSVFDVDRSGAAYAWDDADLPHPTWTAINPENGHAHIAWGWRVPVRVEGDDASTKALRYLAAIEGCISERLGADAGYRGVTTKNPLHPQWIVDHPGRLLLYELNDLAEWLPELPAYRPPRRTQEQAGLGRNVDLFDKLRKWAGRAIRDYWNSGERGRDDWQEKCKARALTLNAEFHAQLPWPEVRHIAKSVARWTWKRVTPEGFREWQAAQGKKGGKASGAARRAGSVTEAAPWAAEGVSRATWYRRQKSGLLVPNHVDEA